MPINEYDDIVANLAPEPETSTSVNEYEDILASEKSAFGLSVQKGAEKTPEVSVQVLDIQKKTGLPAPFIEQNLDPIKQKSIRAEAENFRRSHPVTGQWLAESPYNASLAKDDMENMGTLERGYRAFSGGWKKAGLQSELADLLSVELDGGDYAPGSAQARKRDELKAQIQAIGEEEAQYGTGSYIANVTGYSARQFGQSFKETAEGALAGGITGVVLGLPTGLGSLATGTAGTISGATVAMGNYAYRQEAAFAFDEFRGMTDITGAPLDPTTARNAARGVGVVNASIEILSDAGLTLLVPGAKAVIGKSLGTDAAKQVIRAKVKSALANPTTRGAVLSALGKMGGGASIEGLEELFQELVGAGGREVAQGVSGQEFDPDSFALDIQRAGSAAKDAAVGTFFTLAPLGGAQFYSQFKEVKKAETNRQFFEALGQTAEGSKVRERLPEAFEQMVDRLTKDGPIDTVYAPVEAWNTYWQGKGVDPKAVAEDVLGDSRSYDEAIISGGDIPIPLPKYARKIAPTEHNVFFIDELRTSPTEMNARESREFMAKLEEAQAQPEAAPVEEPGAKVGDMVTEQLIAAGFDESTARAQSSLYEAAFGTLGQRAGIDPMQLFKRYNPTIQRGELQAPVTPSEPDLAKWEEEGGFAPGDMPESVDALSAKLGIEFGPEAAGIVKGVFLPRRVAINEDGSLNLTNSQKTTLELVKGEVEQGEAGFRHFREGDIGGDQVVTAIPSTFPEYFKNKGYSKAETLTAIEKALAGLPLGPRQASIVQDLNEGYRAQAFEELRRIRAERVPQRELSDEEVAALSPEEFSRMFFQGAQVATETPEFKAWFGDSKVVDENGDPLVVYHGTASDVEAFDSKQIGKNFKKDKAGFFFSSSSESAAGFAGAAGNKSENIIPAYLAISNPLQINAEGDDVAEFWFLNTSAYTTQAKEGKYDGVIVSNEDGEKMFVVFHPEQIKSVFNRGTFDPTDPRILYQSAYHGTPHKFDKFTLDHIGKGEGAQAYGWGLYFAENKDVAEWYREKLSADKVGGAKILKDGPNSYSVWGTVKGSDQIQLIAEGLLHHQALQAKEKYDSENKGRLYKVNLTPEKDEYLDWDKPLSEQSEKVGAHLVAIKDALGDFIEEVRDNLNADFEEWTGRELYHALSKYAEESPLPGEGAAFSTSSGNADQDASLYLKSIGIPGIKYLEGASRDKGEGHHNFVIFDEELIEIEEYWQREGDDARGRITLAPGKVNIALLKNANLSTFLHETGHFYFEILGDLAQDPSAPQDIKDDYKTLLDWLEVKDRKEIKTEHHEKWARGFEAYLMEGKAPSAELRAAFARFRAWLIAVYRSIVNLNAELTPEVRDVMDRLLASEEEIRIAQQKQNIVPLFGDPAALGMSEKEINRYAKAIEEAKQSAEEQLSTKMLAQVNREIKSWWKEERAKVYETVKDEVDTQPIYIALSVLQSTKANLPEGVTAAKLSKKSIVELFGGEARLKTLPKPHVYSVEGGMHPDDAADLFGFHSGDELLDALANAEPRKAVINRLTDERMSALYPDLPTDPAKLSEEAMKAVHNEKREELLRLELEHLASNNLSAMKGMIRKVARKVPSTESLRAFAEKTIAAKKERDIKPYLHSRAEARAARKAVDAFNSGEFDLAFHMKLQEAIAHELYRAAIKAREEVDSIVEYAKKFDKTTVRERMGKAGADYLEQIDAILDRYSFKRTTLKALDKRKSLVAWTKEQEAQGLTVTVPDTLLSEAARQHYRETTIEELRGVRDTIKQIEHLASLKNKLLASEKRRDFEEAQDEIIASIEAHHKITPEPIDFAPGLGKRLFTKAKEAIASHTKLEFLFEFLDGNKARGPVWELLFKPFADADDAKSRMNRDVAENMRNILGAYSRKERATWFLKKTHIPLIGKSLNKANMLAVALNQGNLYNRQAVMDGYGWNEDQVQAILSHLDKRDWDTVQALWDYIDSFWPEVKRLEEEITGLAPAKVEAAAVKTRFGDYRGGYYPIVFDRDKSWRQTQLTEEEQVREMFGGKRGRAMTKHGHTVERTNTGGKPILLELTGMTDHIENVVHDIAYRRAIIDAWRLANSERVRQAIIGSAGKEMYAQINPWIRAIASDRRKEPTAHFEALFARARHGATIVNMGWKMTTAMVQFMGYTVSIKELGAKYAALGLKDAYMRPYKLADKWAFITERSEFMKERPRNYDRDVRDTLRGMGAIGKQGIGSAVDTYTVGLRSSWFALIAYMDMAVSIPTWLGAYQKAMDGKVENIMPGDERAAVDFADRTVRITQSSGAAKDLAAIQTGSETWKLFTMFYSYFSLLFNQFGKVYTQFRFDKNIPKLMGSLFLLWFVPAVLEDLLLGRGPDDDDDEDAWVKWAAKNEAMYPFQTVVLARDLVNGMDKFGYEPSAAFDVFEKAAKTGKLGVDLATGEKEELSRTNIKDAVMLVGYFAQLPTRQLWLTGEYFHDWMTGEQEPESPAEGIWRGFVAGKKKD